MPDSLEPAARGSTDEPLDVLLLVSGGVGFALELDAVAHASFLVAVQQVPEAPDYVLGVGRFRGRAVPVLDLAGRLGLTPPERYTVDTPMVWCEAAERTAGLVVDELPGIAEVAPREVRMREAFARGGPPVEAVVRAEERSWLLLDPARVLEFDFAQQVSDIQLDEKAIRKWLEEAAAWSGTEAAGG